jgi:hypothetical protein
MPQVPSFFFSHARQDRETPGKYLRRFFDDLEIKLAQWAAVNLQERRLGTIDSRVPQGENWDADLSHRLATDNTFVAILTPLYFKRPNCGKEVTVFLLRHPNLGIDRNGALTGVKNVLLIRWLPENAYTVNTSKDSLIPPILRLIEDTPADDGRDPERTEAIERYRKKGMEKCVNVEPHYGELLDLFVDSIRKMDELPPASNVSFTTVYDAFTYDWIGHFTSIGVPVAPPSTSALPVAPVTPRALESLVVFYVTRRPFTPDPKTPDFADWLLTEALPDVRAPRDALLDALLADIRAAGVAEGFTVFHAAAQPVVPASAEPLLTRLASLSNSRVLTALVVEPNVWPGTPGDVEAAAVEQIIHSREWTGLVILPSLNTCPINVDELIAARGLPPRLVDLPQESEERISKLRRAFVDIRGRVLRTSTGHAPNAEHLPVLKGISPERT